MPDKYYISKLSFEDDSKRVDSVYAYSYRDNVLRGEGSKNREWLISHIQNNDEVYVMDKNENGDWIQRNQFSFENNNLHWGLRLPRNIERRKVFISFYNEDVAYKRLFEKILDDISINKSVQDGDICPDNADEYIRHIIQCEYLKDTSILIVLIGPNTKNRKHVDWEISGALNYKVGNHYAGVLGLILPNHPDYKSEDAHYSLMPKRVAENFKTGYAIIRDWTTNRCELQQYIEEAFRLRSKDDLRVNDKIPLMQRNLSE